MDIEYSTYFARLTRERQLGSAAGDFALLALTATSTVVPVAATKTVLSAAKFCKLRWRQVGYQSESASWQTCSFP